MWPVFTICHITAVAIADCSVILPGDRITHIDDHALLADEDFQEQLRIHAEAEDRTGFVKVGLTEPYPFRPRDKKVRLCCDCAVTVL